MSLEGGGDAIPVSTVADQLRGPDGDDVAAALFDDVDEVVAHGGQWGRVMEWMREWGGQ